MRVFVTGKTGFIGLHLVRELQLRGHELVELTDRPNAMIHLAWAGLPNYESEEHWNNVQWQAELLMIAARLGVTNIIACGTCLEEVENPPPYALAKAALCRRFMGMGINAKWFRLPYLHGPGQRKACLLPSLCAAIDRGDKAFSVIPGKLPFMHVREAVKKVCDALNDNRSYVANCPGGLERVAEFCRRQIPPNSIQIVEDYPMKPWEK